jgi:hypothetical protein
MTTNQYYSWFRHLIASTKQLPSNAPPALFSNEDKKRIFLRMIPNQWVTDIANFGKNTSNKTLQSIKGYMVEQQEEQQPDPWMRVRYLQYINDMWHKLAEYVHGITPEQAKTLVLVVEGALTAISSNMRSIQWKQGDMILYFDVAYGMVKSCKLSTWT